MAPQNQELDLSCFPPGARRIAEAIGVKGAIALMRRFGGTENWYIPERASVTHKFRQVLNEEQFTALCKAFPKEHIDIPRGRFIKLLKAIILQYDPNYPAKLVATEVGVCQRYVRQVRQLTRQSSPSRQLPLI